VRLVDKLPLDLTARMWHALRLPSGSVSVMPRVRRPAVTLDIG
jgi:hypothetical protein